MFTISCPIGPTNKSGFSLLRLVYSNPVNINAFSSSDIPLTTNSLDIFSINLVLFATLVTSFSKFIIFPSLYPTNDFSSKFTCFALLSPFNNKYCARKSLIFSLAICNLLSKELLKFVFNNISSFILSSFSSSTLIVLLISSSFFLFFFCFSFFVVLFACLFLFYYLAPNFFLSLKLPFFLKKHYSELFQ